MAKSPRPSDARTPHLSHGVEGGGEPCQLRLLRVVLQGATLNLRGHKAKTSQFNYFVEEGNGSCEVHT